MGLLLVLRPPQPRPKSLRRATRAQRREHHRADAEEWAGIAERGWQVDVPVDELLPFQDAADPSRLVVLGQLDPWSDTVLDRSDLPKLEADLERLAAVAESPAQHELVAALRTLLAQWRAEPDLLLYCYGD